MVQREIVTADDVANMSKAIYDIDQAGNVLCTYVDLDQDKVKIVCIPRHNPPPRVVLRRSFSLLDPHEHYGESLFLSPSTPVIYVVSRSFGSN